MFLCGEAVLVAGRPRLISGISGFDRGARKMNICTNDCQINRDLCTVVEEETKNKKKAQEKKSVQVLLFFSPTFSIVLTPPAAPNDKIVVEKRDKTPHVLPKHC